MDLFLQFLHLWQMSNMLNLSVSNVNFTKWQNYSWLCTHLIDIVGLFTSYMYYFMIQAESLYNIYIYRERERCYSWCAILDFKPVAHLVDGCTSQIIKSSPVVHMWLCTCVLHGWNELLILVLYVSWAHTLLLINSLIVHRWYWRNKAVKL